MIHQNYKWAFINVKNFCSVKYPATKMKKQATEWEKILAKHTSD